MSSQSRPVYDGSKDDCSLFDVLDPKHARKLRADACTGGLKWLIDQLVTERILTDDKPKHLTLLPVEQHTSKPYRTEVIVEAA